MTNEAVVVQAPSSRLEPDAVSVAQDALIGLADTGPTVSVSFTLVVLIDAKAGHADGRIIPNRIRGLSRILNAPDIANLVHGYFPAGYFLIWLAFPVIGLAIGALTSLSAWAIKPSGSETRGQADGGPAGLTLRPSQHRLVRCRHR
jgi:hypothetical protein